MTTREAISFFQQELRELYPENEINGIFEFLFTHLTGMSSRFQIYSQRNSILPEEITLCLLEALPKLKQYMPVQYITGSTEFYNCILDVTEDVLIPRPETEELVRWIVDDTKNRQVSIFDVGTGSGNIAVALAKNIQGSKIDACDVSEAALALARNNAAKNCVNINFFNYDILKWTDFKPKCKWDIIVSNPPYITFSEKSMMLPNVYKYEPELALYVPDKDPLMFYKAIAAFSTGHMETGGSLYVEVGENHASELQKWLLDNCFKFVTIKQDINGKNRMIKANNFFC